MSSSYVGGRSNNVGLNKSKYKNTNFNSAMTKTTFRSNVSGGVYVAALDRSRINVNKKVGIAAVPTPVNTPSLRKENRSRDSGMMSVVSGDSSRGWSQSSYSTENGSSANVTTKQPVENPVISTQPLQPPANSTTTTAGSSRSNVWGTVKAISAAAKQEASVALKPAIMPSWADAESDEEEEENESDGGVQGEQQQRQLSSISTSAPSNRIESLGYDRTTQSAAPRTSSQERWGHTTSTSMTTTSTSNSMGRGGGDSSRLDNRYGDNRYTGPSYSGRGGGDSRIPAGRDYSSNQDQGRVRAFSQTTEVSSNLAAPPSSQQQQLDERGAQQRILEESRKEREELERRRRAILQEQHQSRGPQTGGYQQREGYGRDSYQQQPQAYGGYQSQQHQQQYAPQQQQFSRGPHGYSTGGGGYDSQHPPPPPQAYQPQLPQSLQQSETSTAGSGTVVTSKADVSVRWERAKAPLPTPPPAQQNSHPPAPGYSQFKPRVMPPPPLPTTTQYQQQAQQQFVVLQSQQQLDQHRESSPIQEGKSFLSLFVDPNAPGITPAAATTGVSQQSSRVESAELPPRTQESSRKMLFDPKKRILVASEPTPTPLQRQQQHVAVAAGSASSKSSSAAGKSSEKRQILRAEPRPVVVEESWKRRVLDEVSEDEEAAVAGVSAIAESRYKPRGVGVLGGVGGVREPAPLDAEGERLRQERGKERAARSPHTRGVLYAFSSDGQLEQVLSAAERQEQERLAEVQRQRRAALEEQIRLKEARRLEKVARQLQQKQHRSTAPPAATTTTTAVTSTTAPTKGGTSVPAALNTRPLKPAWQAPRQTLVDIGIAPSKASILDEDDDIHSPDANATALKGSTTKLSKAAKIKLSKEVRKGRKEETRSMSTKQQQQQLAYNNNSSNTLGARVGRNAVIIPTTPLSNGGGHDTLNLDIVNQEQPIRDPASYPTFIPGSGLSPGTGTGSAAVSGDLAWQLNYGQVNNHGGGGGASGSDSLNIPGYNLSSLGVPRVESSPNSAPSWSLSSWSSTAANNFLSVTDDDGAAAFSSAAYAIGGDDVPSYDEQGDLPPTLSLSTAPTTLQQQSPPIRSTTDWSGRDTARADGGAGVATGRSGRRGGRGRGGGRAPTLTRGPPPTPDAHLQQSLSQERVDSSRNTGSKKDLTVAVDQQQLKSGGRGDEGRGGRGGRADRGRGGRVASTGGRRGSGRGGRSAACGPPMSPPPAYTAN